MFDLTVFCGVTFIVVLLVLRLYLFMGMMDRREKLGFDRHAKARIGHAAWLMHEHGKTADEAIAEALIIWPHRK